MRGGRTKPIIAKFLLEQVLMDESLSSSIKDKDLAYFSSLAPHQFMTLGFSYIESLDLYRIISVEDNHRKYVKSIEK